jgi:TLC domain
VRLDNEKDPPGRLFDLIFVLAGAHNRHIIITCVSIAFPRTSSMTFVLVSLFQGIYQDPLILRLALVNLVGVAVLTLLFKYSPVEGPWKSTALFSAKQVITIGLMVYQTYYGFLYWSQEAYNYKKSPPHVLVIQDQHGWEGGLFLSRVVLGALLQDIPVGAITGSVDNLMHMHHLGMFLVATISLGFWSTPITPLLTRYTPFFFGVIELSSIPLAIVDVFHPRKQPEWHHFQSKHKAVEIINDISRTSFAFMYVVIRLIYFPQVIFKQVIPDGWNKLQQEENEPYKLAISIVLIFSTLFTLLQLYWGTLVLRQIAKAVKVGPPQEDKKKAKIKAV